MSWGSISPNIYIGGLFELSETPAGITYGQSELAAAQLAIRHINQQRILLGYKLHMLYNDTKVGHNIRLTIAIVMGSLFRLSVFPIKIWV